MKLLYVYFIVISYFYALLSYNNYIIGQLYIVVLDLVRQRISEIASYSYITYVMKVIDMC